MHTEDEQIPVFFYGLFMDESLLKEKGLSPSTAVLCYVQDYQLQVGERATLIKSQGHKAYGTTISLKQNELLSLYQEPSVSDYEPEKIRVLTLRGDSLKVTVYNLPIQKLKGKNKQYVIKLAKTAAKIGLPKKYIQEIESLA